MAIQFITTNEGKFREVEYILGAGTVEQLRMEVPELQELDSKLIVQKKLEAAFVQNGRECMVEDTSLYFDCLQGGLPGPFIKWFLKSLGPEGLASMASKMGNTGALAQTIVGYAASPTEVYYFEGSLRGNIVMPRGQGFGWDSIFQVEGSDKTFGEMTSEEKNSISHRFQAIKKLKDFLSTTSNPNVKN